MFQVIDFGTGIYQQGAQLFMHLPKQSASWGTFVDVFNYTFWVLLVIVALLSSVMFHFVFRLSGFQVTNALHCASCQLTIRIYFL